MPSMLKHEDSAVIDALGGTVATSKLCDVSSQAVTQWRRAGIPKPWRMYLRLLRPQVFQPMAAGDSAARVGEAVQA